MVAAAAILGAGNLVLGLAACQGPQDEMNEVQRAAWSKEIGAARSEWRQAERELWRVEERTRALRRRIDEDLAEAARVRASEQKGAAELANSLKTLRAIEEDLVVAAKRKADIDAELAGIRMLEKQVAKKDETLAGLTAKSAALDKLVAEKQAALEVKRAEVAALVVEIDRELAALTESEAKMRAALQGARKSAGAEENKEEKKEGAKKESEGAKK